MPAVFPSAEETPPRFRMELEVRDYECDLQGVVNNAVYLNYLEHTRHQYLKSVGLDFAEYTSRNVHLVVVRAELDYRAPLRSGDKFVVTLAPVRVSRLRFGFLQNIYQLPGDRLVLTARIVAVALDPNRRPFLPAEIEALLKKLATV